MQEARGGYDEKGGTNKREDGGGKVPFEVLLATPTVCTTQKFAAGSA